MEGAAHMIPSLLCNSELFPYPLKQPSTMLSILSGSFNLRGPVQNEKGCVCGMVEVEQKKQRTFRKFTYRGVDLDQLLDIVHQQQRLNRGLRRKQRSLLKRLRKAKKEAPPMEKPEVMVGSMVGVYNGKTFNQVEIKPEMIGHYLGEFSITYKPVKHGWRGIGATHSSRFIPLK
ncbi:ribosomal protein S15 [Saguinus oedipus]|uniref:40S ribosomal protein S15 n=1 Tax=Saguinus oedipus TaxID=9490 RepID=A0ABQ9VCT4_SAGOE|nr:ribosomal protein S15 [Saguinus oedipus]